MQRVKVIKVVQVGLHTAVTWLNRYTVSMGLKCTMG